MNPARRLGPRGGWPWCVPKLLISPGYHYNWVCLQGPVKDPILINVVTSQAIFTIFTICPIFQIIINIPQTTVLSPSNIIDSYHIKVKYQCMIGKWAANWNYCIQWIHQNQVVLTHNLAPLTRNEKYSIQTYNGNSLQLKG